MANVHVHVPTFRYLHSVLCELYAPSLCTLMLSLEHTAINDCTVSLTHTTLYLEMHFYENILRTHCMLDTVSARTAMG